MDDDYVIQQPHSLMANDWLHGTLTFWRATSASSLRLLGHATDSLFWLAFDASWWLAPTIIFLVPPFFGKRCMTRLLVNQYNLIIQNQIKNTNKHSTFGTRINIVELSSRATMNEWIAVKDMLYSSVRTNDSTRLDSSQKDFWEYKK